MCVFMSSSYSIKLLLRMGLRCWVYLEEGIKCICHKTDIVEKETDNVFITTMNTNDTCKLEICYSTEIQVISY